MIYATLKDMPIRQHRPEPAGERREFDDLDSVADWFDRYLHGYTVESVGASQCAQVQIYSDQLAETPILTLSTLPNPDGTKRIFDRAAGDPVQRGYRASGIQLGEAMAGYVGAQLLHSNLLEDFGVADVPATYRGSVLLGIQYMAGRHPLATRMWLAKHSSREFGVVLYREQTNAGAFWRSTGGVIDNVDATLECYSHYFHPEPLRVVDGRLCVGGFHETSN
ncbi:MULTISPECIES: hypothetical protein [Nocardia]|uniref:hypothetical protein n=1 Tax=Nocardia TaxID=1817 RepID=UPI000D694C93|nr:MULTISPECIES: hypothetical protein [Nocardia]